MILLEDVVKMVNTARGKEKMFGYKSTLANQFHLLYFFCGGFYHDHTVSKQTNFTILSFVLIFQCAGVFCIVMYTAYGDKSDIQQMLYALYATLVMILIYVVEPLLAAYFFKDDIENSIKMADEIIMKRSDCEKLDSEIDVERCALWIIIIQLVTTSTFFFSTTLDTALFYENEKTKDYRYYLIYIPNLDQWGSAEFYFVFNLTIATAAISLCVFYCSMTIIKVAFAGICHNEVQHIANDLNSLSSEDITTVEMYNGKIEPKFRTALKNATRNYQDLTRMLGTFRGYYTSSSGVMLLILFMVELSHAINIILPGNSPAVRFREINAFLSTAIPFFVYCWSGNILEEVAPTVSFAVYSLPWYWSTTHRKDVYILLCQTQVPTDQKAMGVYPIQLRTFLRFLNVIQSTVNVLRAFVHK